jgi:hypothetical protein
MPGGQYKLGGAFGLKLENGCVSGGGDSHVGYALQLDS